VETCAVDASGLLVGERMNDADIEALKKFKAMGILDYGRIPFKLLGQLTEEPPRLKLTHWVTLNDEAWRLAHELRRVRALQIGPSRRKVNDYLQNHVVKETGDE
jgi:hypothetical protein